MHDKLELPTIKKTLKTKQYVIEGVKHIKTLEMIVNTWDDTLFYSIVYKKEGETRHLR